MKREKKKKSKKFREGWERIKKRTRKRSNRDSQERKNLGGEPE